MINSQPLKIMFIVNPVSGNHPGRKQALARLVQERLRVPEIEYEIIQSESPEHAVRLTRDAIDQNYHVVAAVGGDGSINQVARNLIGTNVSLAIIPAGSGNGLAHHLGIPLSVAGSLEVLLRGKTTMIDTVKINDSVFFSIAGMGFDAKVARKYAGFGRRGFLPYLKIITELYPAYRPKKYTLTIDGQVIHVRALLIAFANSNQFGYDTVIAPHASVRDGLLDICIVQKVPIYSLPLVLPLLFTKRIDQSEYIEIFKAKEVIAEQKRNRFINLDGESVKLGKKLHISVQPASLKVIIP